MTDKAAWGSSCYTEKENSMKWQSIATAPRDRAILLRGGAYSSDDETSHSMPDYRPPPAAVAVWRDDTVEVGAGDYLSNDSGCWIVAYYDFACGSVCYNDPTEWLDIPD